MPCVITSQISSQATIFSSHLISSSLNDTPRRLWQSIIKHDNNRLCVHFDNHHELYLQRCSLQVAKAKPGIKWSFFVKQGNEWSTEKQFSIFIFSVILKVRMKTSVKVPDILQIDAFNKTGVVSRSKYCRQVNKGNYFTFIIHICNVTSL